MKQIKFLLITILLTATIISCEKKNEDIQKGFIPGSDMDTLVGEITVNRTLVRNTYLKGLVFAKSGVTLTVNPGVTIFGAYGDPEPQPSLQRRKVHWL